LAVPFPAIFANQTNTAVNPGTSAHDFIATLNITDPDAGAVRGIAVTSVETSHGTWQYSVDSGAHWTPFIVSDASSLLLADNSVDRIRFVPVLNFQGTATFTFRAWDQTSGVDGGLADTRVNGGTTAFSIAVGTATITVRPVAQDLVARVAETGAWYVSATNGVNGFANPTTLLNWAPNSPTLHWVNVMTGNFIGDGHTDLIGQIQEYGQWWVSVPNGNGGYTTSLWATWTPESPTLHWVDVHVADFTGAGRDAIIGRYLETDQWWVGVSDGIGHFTTSLWATWSTAYHWVDVQVGDLTGNHKADVVGRALESGQWFAGVSTGTGFFTNHWDTWSAAIPWADVRLADLTGSGREDIIGRVPSTGQWWAGISTGTQFRTSPWSQTGTSWNPAFTYVDVHVGDFNGDGKADIVGRAVQTGQWFVSVSGTSGFTSTSPWVTWDPTRTWVDVQVGDFNGDGRDDIVGRDAATGQWRVNLSTGSAFASSVWVTWDPTDPRFRNMTIVDAHTGLFH
jgi:hypothetical protein